MIPQDVFRGANKLGLPLTDAQAGSFVALRDLLVDWNARFNLTALTDDDAILALHFLDSLTALPAIAALQAQRRRPLTLIDVGTGAGFPGLPLKIALPDLNVTLMDSTAKKVQFCSEAIRALQLAGAQAVHGRAEEAGHQPQHREQYDVVIARAVAPLPTLVEYLLPLARVGGLCVCMKGSDAQSEAAQAAGAITKLGGALKRIDTVSIPDRDDKRALILIDKTRPSLKLYPRQAGAPRKTPLQ
jgi:16S rRNA (guanine527-N7)-methyltransferase